jgi:hypothetical protein
MSKLLKAVELQLGLDPALVEILAGSVNPTAGGGVPADIGSLYLRTNGTLFIKIGAGATQWSAITPGNAQRFTYVADGSEGSSFNIPLPAARANTNYQVSINQATMTAALAIIAPTAGRTTALFPVQTSSAVVAGDTFEITVVDPT